MFSLTEHNNQALAAVIIATSLLALDYVVVALRFWARRMKRHSPGLSEWLILASLVSTFPWQGWIGNSHPRAQVFTSANYSVCLTIYLRGGTGLHQQYVDAVDPGATLLRRKVPPCAPPPGFIGVHSG